MKHLFSRPRISGTRSPISCLRLLTRIEPSTRSGTTTRTTDAQSSVVKNSRRSKPRSKQRSSRCAPRLSTCRRNTARSLRSSRHLPRASSRNAKGREAHHASRPFPFQLLCLLFYIPYLLFNKPFCIIYIGTKLFNNFFFLAS